jgi:hypothetical protein
MHVHGFFSNAGGLCLLGCLIVTVCHADNTLVAPTPAFYPRAVLLGETGEALASVEASGPCLVVFHRAAIGADWGKLGVVACDTNSTSHPELTNGHMLVVNASYILVAYRHHTGSATDRVYRIQVSLSVDRGQTWSLIATPTTGPTGVWGARREPRGECGECGQHSRGKKMVFYFLEFYCVCVCVCVCACALACVSL